MGSRKSGFDIRPCACPAWRSCSRPTIARLVVARLIVARLYAVAAASLGSHPAKSLLPLVVVAAASTTAAGHVVIYVTALHVAATEARGCVYIGMGARSP